MAIQLCPVDTANVHPRNILGSSSSFDRERLSPFSSLSSRCWETVVYITLSSGPAQPGCSVRRLHCPPNPYLSTCWMVQRLTSRSLASSRWLTPFDRSTRM